MKLIKMVSYIRNFKEYYKFRINLKSSLISELKWSGGEELDCTIRKIGKVRGLFITKISKKDNEQK
jgi:hypothetical protein